MSIRLARLWRNPRFRAEWIYVRFREATALSQFRNGNKVTVKMYH